MDSRTSAIMTMADRIPVNASFLVFPDARSADNSIPPNDNDQFN
jgi:hypothetical protein